MAGLQYAPMQPQHQQLLKQFWKGQKEEIMQVQVDPNEFKNHQLPLARIKKIMKSDEDVRMIAAEAPVLFAKACEMFILELTLRSWIHSEENKRRTLQRNDITAAITKTDIFDFLVDIVPRDEVKEEAPGPPRGGPGGAGGMAGASYAMQYYMPQQGMMPGHGPPGGDAMQQHMGQPYMMAPGYMPQGYMPHMPPGGMQMGGPGAPPGGGAPRGEGSAGRQGGDSQ